MHGENVKLNEIIQILLTMLEMCHFLTGFISYILIPTADGTNVYHSQIYISSNRLNMDCQGSCVDPRSTYLSANKIYQCWYLLFWEINRRRWIPCSQSFQTKYLSQFQVAICLRRHRIFLPFKIRPLSCLETLEAKYRTTLSSS